MNKGNKCTTCGYSLFTQCSFDNIRSKHDYYRGKDCIKSLHKQKFCYICRNKFNSDSKIHRNVGDHYHYTEKKKTFSAPIRRELENNKNDIKIKTY